MNKFFHFFLNNQIMDYSMCIIFIINIFSFMYLDNKYEKNFSRQYSKEENRDKLRTFKIITLLIEIIVLLVCFINKLGYLMLIVCFFVFPTISLINAIINVFNKKTTDFSYEKKYMYAMAALIFILFFSNEITQNYIQIFSNISHLYKEILIIIYLIAKIGLYAFLISLNILILISNINEILLENNKKMLSLYLKKTNQKYFFLYYDFILYKKYNNNFTLIIDGFIFAIHILPALLLNAIIIVILIMINYFKSIFYKIIKIIENENNWNQVIKRITNVSVILSLVCVFILIVAHDNIFSNKLKEIYSFISSVVLIPLIYDSIKSKQEL